MPSPSDSQLPGLPGFDPYNIQPWTVQVVTSMTVLALVSVGLRLWSRHLKQQKLWWDDWLILFSMGWNLVVVGFIFAMHSCGMGIHADLVDPADIVMMAKWLVVAEILYAFNLGWTKLSLLLMYYRIFRVPYFKKIAWVVGPFVMAWVVCITFLFVFICVPVEKLWYPDLPGRCINQVGTWIANAASTILTDVIILLLPIHPMWSIKLKMRERIGLTAAFGLGFFVVFASAYRTSVLFTYDAKDPTYTLAPTVGWTAIEMSAGIVSACLPTMLPIINHFLAIFGFKSGRTTATNSEGCSNGGFKPNSRTNNTRSSTNFERLSDDADTDTNRDRKALSVISESDLRPDAPKSAYQYAVHTVHGDDRDGSADDVPLRSIRVQTAIEHSAAKM